jgi:hypothetical protein
MIVLYLGKDASRLQAGQFAWIMPVIRFISILPEVVPMRTVRSTTVPNAVTQTTTAKLLPPRLWWHFERKEQYMRQWIVSLSLLCLLSACVGCQGIGCRDCGPRGKFKGLFGAKKAACGACASGGCESGACGGGACAGGNCGLGGGMAAMHQRPPEGPAGPPVGTYAYPYYTLRGPRDFLQNNPPSIGP